MICICLLLLYVVVTCSPATLLSPSAVWGQSPCGLTWLCRHLSGTHIYRQQGAQRYKPKLHIQLLDSRHSFAALVANLFALCLIGVPACAWLETTLYLGISNLRAFHSAATYYILPSALCT